MKRIIVILAIAALAAGCATQTQKSKRVVLLPPLPPKLTLTSGGLLTVAAPSILTLTNHQYTNNPILTNQIHQLKCTPMTEILCSTNLVNWQYFGLITDTNTLSIFPARTNLFFRALLLQSQINLAWDMVVTNGISVIGYRVYCGPAPKVYDVTYYCPGAKNTNVSLWVPVYSTNYVSVTALTTNLESSFSGEAKISFPSPVMTFQ